MGKIEEIDNFCLSSYLAFRYVAKKNCEWLPGISPEFPPQEDIDQIPIATSEEILTTLRQILDNLPDIAHTAIFLSGGIDSAIITALLPEGCRAYTINFMAETGVKEAEQAKKYTRQRNMEHTVVNVTWDDYEKYESFLMSNKKAPLHAVEVALYKAALKAKDDNVKTIILGNGADSTFGGLDKLLSRDWKFEEFVNRYTFIKPWEVLKKAHDIREIYEPYRRGDSIDFINFLKIVHGTGVIQAFNNSIHAAGLNIEEPFEKMRLRDSLDLDRIRAGEPKYLLVEVFKSLYPDIAHPNKIPFARPMTEWLSNYKGPKSGIFRENLDMASFSGDQRYLLHCLDKFVYLLETGNI